MHETAFSPANILLPQDCGLTKWAVVACDQFTSQPEYWERVDQFVGDAPSTLRLILPESKLESEHVEEEIQKINQTMEQYLEEGRLRELEDAMIFLERKLSNGKTRLGLIGKLDLEQYSYEKGSGTPIRATEGTVLPHPPPDEGPEKRAHRIAPTLWSSSTTPKKNHRALPAEGEQEADADDLQHHPDGTGWPGLWVSSLQGTGRQGAEAAGRPGRPGPFRSILPRRGQACADLRHGRRQPLAGHRQGLLGGAQAHSVEAERQTHPARYALVELVNLHDDSLEFEPIHRVLFGVDPQAAFGGPAGGISRRPLWGRGGPPDHLCPARGKGESLPSPIPPLSWR